jgi:hypothetical protein
VQRFPHEDGGNAEPGLFHEVALLGVPQHRRVVRADLGIDIEHLADRRLCGLVRKLTGAIDDSAVALRIELFDLFFQRHAAQQIRDALLDGQGRIAIRGNRVLGDRRAGQQQRHEAEAKDAFHRSSEMAMA